MQRPRSLEEVDAWMSEYGWYPGRDIGEQAANLVATVQGQYAEEGAQLELPPSAEAFIRAYGGLRVLIDDSPENYAVLTPVLVYAGEAEDVQEFAENLSEKLFPIGYSTYEGPLYMDSQSRIFMNHDTGPYYLGKGAREGLMNLLLARTEDAEDYFV